MKVIFLDSNKDSKEYETGTQDFKYLFQIAEKLSDSEFEKLKLAIDKFPQIDEI